MKNKNLNKIQKYSQFPKYRYVLNNNDLYDDERLEISFIIKSEFKFLYREEIYTLSLRM